MTSLMDYCKRLEEAQTKGIPIRPFTSENPALSVDQAYAIQRLSLEQALARGETLCGYKMGLTSLAKQRDVKVFEPICGFLLNSREILKGAAVSVKGRIHPRVEPEVAVIVKSRLKGPDVTVRDVLQAIESIVPALEILDSRFEGFNFSLPDVIADNTSASGYILGSQNLLGQLAELRLMGIVMKHNGVVVEAGCPAAVLGDPLLSVVALARMLSKEGKSIEPGMVILTGGITASVSFRSGDTIEANFPAETLAFRAV